MKKIFKVLFYSLLVVIFATAIYFLFAVILSLIPVNKDFRNAVEGIEIYIRSNGVHTEFVLPAKTEIINWTGKIPYSDFAAVDSGFHYIGFGWGNREFYIETKEWSDLKISTALKAGLGIGGCAMHIEYLRKPHASKNRFPLVIDKEQYRTLVHYILNSFQTDSAGNFIHIAGSGYYGTDTFYEARGRYTIFQTCNEWTGSGLRQAGIRTGAWTPFEKSVVYHLYQISENQ